MKSKKQEIRGAAVRTVQTEPRWPLWTAAAAAIVLAWWAWGAASHGPFLFDDNVLPFQLRGTGERLTVWLQNVRPVTMLSYWLSAQLGGGDTYPYHVLSVLFHFVTSGLVYLIVRRLADWSGMAGARLRILAAFAAAIYLLHPAQAESVAYLAGRAEVVSVLFAFAAFAVFLYRREKTISWPAAAAVFALFGLALLSKEHTIVLPAVLLLTDFWWNPGFRFTGIRQNWKLYGPMALGAAFGVWKFWNLLTRAETAGFGMKDLTWYQYLFTQFRAIFVYIGMFVAPVHLTADWDFPLSKTIFDGGAIFGLILLLALAAAAWIYRRRFPLASYGFFLFLLLMAPTSSILPIKDPIAERRIYFAMPGLLLIAVDLLGRVKLQAKALAGACAAVAVLAAIGAHTRAEVWSDPVLLWEDTVQKSPNKVRAHFQLAQSYYEAGRPDAAAAEFGRTARIQPPDYNLLVDWALAYDAMGREQDAIAKLQQAASLERTAHVYSQIAMVYAKQRRWPEAIDALNTAEKLDPGFAPVYNYRAKIHFQQNELCPAIADYKRALALDPRLTDAQAELTRAEIMARTAGGC